MILIVLERRQEPWKKPSPCIDERKGTKTRCSEIHQLSNYEELEWHRCLMPVLLAPAMIGWLWWNGKTRVYLIESCGITGVPEVARRRGTTHPRTHILALKVVSVTGGGWCSLRR
jgi:hypothetical protein